MTEQPKLTVRESEVKDLLLQGFTNEQIAKRLDFSIHTVKVYVSGILRKLEVKNRIEVALLEILKLRKELELLNQNSLIMGGV